MIVLKDGVLVDVYPRQVKEMCIDSRKIEHVAVTDLSRSIKIKQKDMSWSKVNRDTLHLVQ